MTYTVEGRRVYIQLPLGSLLKSKVKSAGAHWDPDRIAWWIGTTNPRTPALLAVLDDVIAAEATTGDLTIDGLPDDLNPTVLRDLVLLPSIDAVWGKVGGSWVVVARADRVTVPGEVTVTKSAGGSATATVGDPIHTGTVGDVPVVVCRQVRESRSRVKLPPPVLGEWRAGKRCDECGARPRAGCTYVADMSGIPGWACERCEDRPSFA
ncbi:hypothetical protein [Mycobacteroides abscessus]|uniref:hypothetical protein n=1 Tax=Mycobacteroides abscessus TaxID=36809 RepID=UPI0019D11878|nr:hypothetical protein [Mycobacteroides abscessus]MBN7457549.1 hypothetical protein [Mycobacteroides abscessus subsp. abscessus]